MSLIGEMYHVRPYHSLTGDVELCNVMYKVPKLQEEIHIHTKKVVFCFISQLVLFLIYINYSFKVFLQLQQSYGYFLKN